MGIFVGVLELLEAFGSLELAGVVEPLDALASVGVFVALGVPAGAVLGVADVFELGVVACDCCCGCELEP